MLIVKIIGVFLGTLGTWKIFYEMKAGMKANLRAEYEFARKFLSDVNKENLHPFSLEKGYQAIAGTGVVKLDEVEYILTLKNPAQCLKDYVFAKELMGEMEAKEGLRLRFKPRYIKKWYRVFLKALYFNAYILCGFISFMPFIAQNYYSLSKMFFMLLFSIPVGGFFAWAMIASYFKIKRGEELINSQDVRTQRVIAKSQRIRTDQATAI